LTYHELNVKSNQLAHYLRFVGVEPEDPVPIFLERSPAFIISLFAVLKAGGACMPLDPSYPKNRIEYMLQQSEARVVLTHSSLVYRLPDVAESDSQHHRKFVCVDTDAGLIGRGATHNPALQTQSNSLAYVLYTSGSTGQPKGVMLSHKALVNYISWHIPYYEMTAADRHAHYSSLAFDASMAETWPSLAVGASLWQVCGDDIRLQPTKLMQWFTEHKVTMCFLTTQLCEALLATPYPSDLTLRILYTGGDKLHRGPTVGAKFTLVNIYGPTENTINTTMCKVPAGQMTPPPIGKPVPNTQIYVVDENMEPVPVGVYGELYLGGVQLAKGYFRRPDLTKERFVPNPFSDDPTSRLYKTGDLVRYLTDGTVEFLGRKDGQVKIRGFRIELSEIEAAILECDEIGEATVICREDKPGDKKLVGYLVLKATQTLAVPELKSRLRTRLPEFMVPAAFVFLDKIILTPNGKVDRNVLPPPQLDDVADRDYIAPRTPLETTVASLCAGVLGLDRVGMMDNFFDIGGHSLAAAQLLSRIRESLQVDLPLGRLFEMPTLSALCESIQTIRGSTNNSRVAFLVPSVQTGVSSVISTPPILSLKERGVSTPTSHSSALFQTMNNVSLQQMSSVKSPGVGRSAESSSPQNSTLRNIAGTLARTQTGLSTWVQNRKARGLSSSPLLSEGANSDDLGDATSVASSHQESTHMMAASVSSLGRISTSARDSNASGSTSVGLVSGPTKMNSLVRARNQLALSMRPPNLNSGGDNTVGNFTSTPSCSTPLLTSGTPPVGSFESTQNEVAAELSKLQALDEHPMCAQQTSLWFMNRLDAASVTYTVFFVAKIFSKFHESEMRQAVRLLVGRHASLRTTFFENAAGVPTQKVHQFDPFSSQSSALGSFDIDFKCISAEGWNQTQIDQALRSETHTPFDLTNGPVFRVRFFRQSDSTKLPSGHLHIMAHHIAIDGWSLDLLLNELGILYQNCVQAKALGLSITSDVYSMLPPVGTTMVEFSYFQRKLLQSAEGDRLLSFWQRTLSAPLPLLQLPTDRTRPPVATYHGDIYSWVLPERQAAGLRALAKAEKSTMYMLLLSTYLMLLHKYSHQDDILLGTPMACRSHLHLERTIGNLVNPVVLRADMKGDPSFSQLLLRVKQLVIAAFSHQDLPFSTVVERIETRRDPSRSPFFQVFFSLNQKFMKSSTSSFVDGESSGVMQLGDELECQPLTLVQKVSPFDITLVMTETDSQISAAFQYNTDLFDLSTIERMSQHLSNLWTAVLQDPKAPMSDISCLDSAEWQKVIIEWNQTKMDVKGKAVHRNFEQQAALTPFAIAISDGPHHFTYNELNKRANCLANHFRDVLGVRTGGVVGVFVKRGFNMILSMLAIMKAGAAYLPIDPAYPRDRVQYMLEDTQATVIVSESSVMEAFKSEKLAANVVQLDSDWSSIRSASNKNPKGNLQGNDLAYVVYTSGSTGKPKGVSIMHLPLVSMSQWHAKEYKHHPTDRSSQMIAPAFDPVALEFWPYFHVGASVHFMPDAARASPQALMSWIASNRITSALFATPVAETVIHEVWPQYHCLKFMTSGGDKLHRGPRVPQTFRLDNHYGPSENTIITTFFPVPSTMVSPPPIGRPVANTTCYVLDNHLQPVPIGVPGELYVGGDCLARGYWHREELTKERFLHSAFSADPNEKIYKTGDLVRYLPDGQLEFFGRVDLQVKIRGFRIEIGEIESVLAQHPGIVECCVEVREPTVGNKQLAGYVVFTPEAAASPSPIESLKQFIKESLPEYMVPQAFVVMTRLPLTANGKVDRKQLPEPDWRAASDSAHEFVAPQTPLQVQLASIWSSILGMDIIGINDNFFDLGGHSLTAAKLLARIRDAFQIDLPVAKIFEDPTIERLAAALESIRSGTAAQVFTDLSGEAQAVWTASKLPDQISRYFASHPEAWSGSRLMQLSISPNHIFLTGASGYLGAFLLATLLQKSSAVIHCLVRASDSSQGVERLWSNIRRFSLDSICESQWNRVRPICGDLGKPMFGLSEVAFDALAKQVDSIYHAGALVNSVLPYSQLKAPNVLGTVEVLRLSLRGGVKPVHHISTLSVFPEVDYVDSLGHKTHVVTEDTPLPTDCSSTLREGYALSKWVADKVIILAYQSKLPVAIYRFVHFTCMFSFLFFKVSFDMR
jgi:amino acid adenylation domain-containing protein